MAEFRELAEMLPPQKRPRVRTETFELPPTLLPSQRLYPRGSSDTPEMSRALRSLAGYFNLPEIEIPDYPGVNDPPFYAVPLSPKTVSPPLSPVTVQEQAP